MAAGRHFRRPQNVNEAPNAMVTPPASFSQDTFVSRQSELPITEGNCDPDVARACRQASGL